MKKLGYTIVILMVAAAAVVWTYVSMSRRAGDPSFEKRLSPNASVTPSPNRIAGSTPPPPSEGKADRTLSPGQGLDGGKTGKPTMANKTPQSPTTSEKVLQGGVSSSAPSGNPVSTAKSSSPDQETGGMTWFKNPSIPIKTRQAEIQNLAARADAGAQQELMAIGNAEIYLNREAVEALGAFAQSPQKQAVAAYLREKMGSKDCLMASAAARGYARLMGADGVGNLAEALKNNRERLDGHQQLVQTSIVVALGEQGSVAAVEPLKAELGRSEESDWRLDYGSAVVKALRRSGTEEARRAMLAYADRLAARIPSDPMAKEYFEAKISEARAAAGQ